LKFLPEIFSGLCQFPAGGIDVASLTVKFRLFGIFRGGIREGMEKNEENSNKT
jgi:hypothetical protein